MKIYDKNQIAYQDIKIEDNTIFLKSDTFEKKINIPQNRKKNIYKFSQQKKMFSSKVMFINITYHYIKFEINIDGYEFSIQGSLSDFHQIKKILGQINFNDKLVIPKKIKAIYIKSFGKSYTSLNKMGVVLEYQNGTRDYQYYSDFSMRDEVLNHLLENSDEVQLKSELPSLEYPILFYVLGGFVILSVVYMFLPLAFEMNLMFYLFLGIIILFSFLGAYISILFIIKELTKYEYIFEKKTNYERIKKRYLIKTILSILIPTIFFVFIKIIFG